jgi:uncharacterized protein
MNGQMSGAAPWAMVTGASSGIGEEIARDLAERGWNLFLTARSLPALEILAEELERMHGIQAEVFPLDLGEPGAAEALEAASEGAGIRIDLLVNNAGFGFFGGFLESPPERYAQMVQLNVTALTELSHRIGGPMAARGSGRILNVASVASFQPGPGMAVYYATKAYVLSLSEALRVEFEPYGVSVTTLCPGPTTSGFQAVSGMGASPLMGRIPMATSRQVAHFGVDAALKGKGIVVPGWMNTLLVSLVGFVPRSLLPRIVDRLQRSRR